MPRLATPPPEHLELLYRAGLEFNSTLDADELLPRVFDRAIEILDAEAGSIWLRREDVLVCEVARGPVAAQIEGLELPMGAGIVGSVALSGTAELIEDVRGDPRFVHQVDEATGFETRSLLTVPFAAKGEVLGVLQVLNRRSGSGHFDAQDLALLEGLAATAGLALHNARLFGAERQARDLRTLLAISRELTSTMDVDRLLLSAVNLGSQVLAYDRAALAVERGGKTELRAISGEESVDASDPVTKALEEAIVWLQEQGRTVYVTDLEEPGEEAKAAETLGPDLTARSVRSFFFTPLEDEEGRLGALYLESSRPGFLGENGREAALLLANQVSISLRNAELYGQVPFIGFLEPVAAFRNRLAAMPRGRLVRRILLPAAVVIGVLLIPRGERIVPREASILPTDRMPVRATVGGLLSRIEVSEGQQVSAGDELAVLRNDELAMEEDRTSAALGEARRSEAAARARGDDAAGRMAEIRARELSGRLALLQEEVARTHLRAPVGGTVLTLRPHEKLGQWLAPGETFVVLGHTRQVELEGRVGQDEIGRVRPGQEVRLKAASRPGLTFVGRVVRVAPSSEAAARPSDEASAVTPAAAGLAGTAASASEGSQDFVVRAVLDNPDGELRPGMDVKAKIVGARRPIGYLILRPFVQWIQLHFWL